MDEGDPNGDPNRDVGPTLPRFALATDGLPGNVAFEQWRNTVAPVFDAGIAPGTHIDQFAIAFEAFNFGPLVLGRTRGSGSQTFDRTTPTVARSGVDHILVQAYVRGSSHVAAEGNEFGVAPGDVWLFDMARTLRTKTRDFANVSLAVPRAMIEPLVPDGDALHGLKLGGDTALGGLLYDHIRGLEARAPRMTPREAISVAESTVHLVAGCVGPVAEARGLTDAGMASALLSHLRRDIDANLSDPDLGPDLLMRRHGLSRARLYRLFEPLGGVADYIRRRRLRRCFLDLASPSRRDVRIAEIAQAWGFGNEAVFSRAFKARFGITPSEVRRMRSDGLAGAFLRDDGSRSPLEQWMHDLMGS